MDRKYNCHAFDIPARMCELDVKPGAWLRMRSTSSGATQRLG
jgi:hypothetical protein